MPSFVNTIILDKNVLVQNKTANGPFVLTIDPRSLVFDNKVRRIEYIWGDGTTEIVDFKPSPDPKSIVGSPLKFPKTKEFLSKSYDITQYNIIINVYLFGGNTTTFQINLELLNPNLNYGNDNFAEEFHLVKTRMYGPDNKILYVFQSQPNDYIFMATTSWTDLPMKIETPKSLLKPYKIGAPFEEKLLTAFPENSAIKIIPYKKLVPINPDDGTEIKSLI
jgi:hypothetical protein